MSDSPWGRGRIRSKSCSQQAESGSPPLDLELPDPAKREGLEDVFEDTEHAGEEPVEDPGDLVERPSSAA